MSDVMGPSPYQARSLAAPETYNQLHVGGRGGGKTRCMEFAIARHCEKYGARAHVLVARRTFPGMKDIERSLHHVLVLAFGEKVRWNGQEHVFRMPNSATVELRSYESMADFEALQGREATLIVVDEVGQYPDPAVLFVLRSLLRGPADIPKRMLLAANPGGPGHAWLWMRFISKTRPWVPFTDEVTGSEWILCPSTVADNPFVDREQYVRELESSTAHDLELRRAWVSGDWDILRGCYFSGCLDQAKVAVDPSAWTPERLANVLAPPADSSKRPEPGSPAALVDAALHQLGPDPDLAENPPEGWLPGFQLFLSLDFGVAAPSVCYVLARSRGCTGPDGFYYPADSVIAVDEWTSAREDNPNEGSGLSVPAQAREIKAMAARWKMPARGTADDSIFSRQRGFDVATIADEFRECGVRFSPAKKGSRLAGWSLMRSLFSQAGSPDLPGLYLSRACTYAWATLPSLERNPRNPEDMRSDGPDHGADALRYGLLWTPPAGVTFQKIQGYF